jgi:hypothetical protein
MGGDQVRHEGGGWKSVFEQWSCIDEARGIQWQQVVRSVILEWLPPRKMHAWNQNNDLLLCSASSLRFARLRNEGKKLIQIRDVHMDQISKRTFPGEPGEERNPLEFTFDYI